MKETRLCLNCSEPFTCEHSRPNKFCGVKCARTAIGKSQRKAYPIEICEACGKEFECRRYDTVGKYCSRVCSDKADKQVDRRLPRITKVCPFCNKEFETLPYNETTCCSPKCGARHVALTLVGKAHPLHKPKTEMACEVCGKICQVKPSLISRFRSCSKRCNAYLAQKVQPRISSIETAMLAELRAKGYAPEGQYSIPPFWADIAFPAEQLVIECDGDYWHGNERQQAKDRQKDGYLRHRGWHVLRLTETQIKADISECVAKVVSFLSSPPALLVE